MIKLEESKQDWVKTNLHTHTAPALNTVGNHGQKKENLPRLGGGWVC
jgi:hypothetical protein